MQDESNATVRNLAGVGWQVRLDGHLWHTCRQELDARFIANGMLIAHAVARGERTGEEVARELEQAASALERQIGPCESGRVLASAAAYARQSVTAGAPMSDWVKEEKSYPIRMTSHVINWAFAKR